MTMLIQLKRSFTTNFKNLFLTILAYDTLVNANVSSQREAFTSLLLLKELKGLNFRKKLAVYKFNADNEWKE